MDEFDQIHPGKCIEHNLCMGKLGQLCTWKEQHEAYHREDEAKMRKEIKDLEKAISNQKTWLISALVALCLNLVATLFRGLI